MLPDLVKSPASVIMINDPDKKAREIWDEVFASTEMPVNAEFIELGRWNTSENTELTFLPNMLTLL